MTTALSSDIYEITKYVDEIKAKHIDVPEDTLAMGMFGYLSEVNSNMLQNSIVIASEYSNEAIPVKAKFEKNIITHALALGITDIFAKPAMMSVMLTLPEEYLIWNMTNNKFILDKNIKIFIESFEYHIDYDIIISRNKLSNGEYVYTALYDIDGHNAISDITNPYLPPVGRINVTNLNLIVINCVIRQIKYTKIYKKILTNNPLENKIINFNFETQLAYFDLDVNEGGNKNHLTPVYDGLIDYKAEKYCNYSYMDSSNMRLKFNRNSYEPRINCDVTINVYTTQGSKGNFKYTDDIMIDLSSDRFAYDRMFMIIKPITDSINGTDKKTIDELKIIIPKEALSRGSITNYTDLNNFFNSINDSNSRLYFLEKIHNQLTRLYYSYILLKKDNVVIPTNTLDIFVRGEEFSNSVNNNSVFKPGNTIYYERGIDAVIKPNDITNAQVAVLESTGFVYMNPFLCVVNKSPFYVSYYMNIINKTKYLNFDYINQDSQIQFIAPSIKCKREFFTDRNKYKIDVSLLQNINSDMGLIEKDRDGNVIKCNIKVIALMYNGTAPYKYAVAEFKNHDGDNFIYDFEFTFETNDIMDKSDRLKIENIHDIGSGDATYGYFDSNFKMKLYILIDTGTPGFRDDLDKYVPNISNYTLCNRYNVLDGVDLFYNYTNIISSYVKLKRNSDNTISYGINKMPLVRKTFVDTEAKMQSFVYEVEKKKAYIEYCLTVLEDSFGIDLKFFNTYGPAKLFEISDGNFIDSTNVSLAFEVQFATMGDRYIAEYIIGDVKEYMEDLNNISNFHAPNVITYITTKYRQQIVYFQFIGINKYGPQYQHIRRLEGVINNVVPEFLNINTKSDGTPDITLTIIP